jgi:endonuclease YncB( thermonuclease family)
MELLVDPRSSFGYSLCMRNFLLYLFVFALPASADTLSGRVVGVSDGDTISVLGGDYIQYKIRLSGIDAPEKNQAFGQRSKEHLRKLVFGKLVTVEWHKTDRYKRIIGKVLVADPACAKADCPKIFDACLSQVRAGFAWWYRQYAKDQLFEDRQRYESAENEAKARKAGLWIDSEPTPPWEFRHIEKQ